MTLNKYDFPLLRFCTCGHVLEWHWYVGVTGGVILSDTHGNRCPAGDSCPCASPTWDGNEPRHLTPLRREDCAHPHLGGTK
jgi:hypothetical protein